MSPFAQGLGRGWRALGRDRRGSVLAEAAVIMPLLVLLLLGGYDIARLALLQQKLSRTTIAAADIVSQGETISQPEVDSILSATGTMMVPFTTGASQQVVVSSVSRTGAANPKVDWQRLGGGTLSGVTSRIGAVGADATLPAGFLVRDGENVIIAEIFYQFSPTFLVDLFPANILYHRAMFRPRVISLSTLCATPC